MQASAENVIASAEAPKQNKFSFVYSREAKMLPFQQR